MQFALTQEQNLLKDAVDKFVRDRYGDNQRRHYRADFRGYSLENWRTLADMGILSLPFMTQDGGAGGGPRELIILLELVSPAAAGIDRRDFRLTDGSSASSIRFRGVAAGERLCGGYAEFAGAIDTARLAAGAEMLGIMSTLFESTVDYLRSREQFGVPLASFQALQHRLADLYVLLEQSRSHLYRAAVCMEVGKQRERSVAGMKSYISSAAIELGEECVHLHGGIGTTDELALGHGYKRLLVLATLFGDANAELVRFGRLAG